MSRRRVDPMDIVRASIEQARGNAVRQYMRDQDPEALRRRDEFAAEIEARAAELVKRPRR